MELRPRAILLIGVAGLAGCSAWQSRAPAKAASCEPSRVEQCTSRCGPEKTHETREGRCEAVVHDLCRAHCDEGCGEAASLAERIGSLEARLDRECGSGRPIEPEEHPPPIGAPTPNPVDRLLL